MLGGCANLIQPASELGFSGKLWVILLNRHNRNYCLILVARKLSEEEMKYVFNTDRARHFLIQYLSDTQGVFEQQVPNTSELSF